MPTYIFIHRKYSRGIILCLLSGFDLAVDIYHLILPPERKRAHCPIMECIYLGKSWESFLATFSKCIWRLALSDKKVREEEVVDRLFLK